MVKRPTDEQLEARAEWLESHAEYSEALDVAAMLRACKGRGNPVTWRWHWNAAIEAAAKVVEVCDWGHHWNLDGEYVDPSDLSDAIRALKKGQTND